MVPVPGTWYQVLHDRVLCIKIAVTVTYMVSTAEAGAKRRSRSSTATPSTTPPASGVLNSNTFYFSARHSAPCKGCDINA